MSIKYWKDLHDLDFMRSDLDFMSIKYWKDLRLDRLNSPLPPWGPSSCLGYLNPLWTRCEARSHPPPCPLLAIRILHFTHEKMTTKKWRRKKEERGQKNFTSPTTPNKQRRTEERQKKNSNCAALRLKENAHANKKIKTCKKTQQSERKAEGLELSKKAQTTRLD